MNIPTQLKAFMAAGSVGACIALYGLMFMAGRVVPTGGVDATHGVLIWIASAIPAFLIGWASLTFTRQLFAEVKREQGRA